MSVRGLVLSLALICAAAGGAFADDAAPPALSAPPVPTAHPGPLTAAEIQAQLRAALGPIGGDQAAPGRKVRVTAEGDHFRMTLPFLSMMNLMPQGPGSQAASMTATLRQVAGRWELGDIRSPSPVSYAVSLPQPKGKPPIEVKVTSTTAEQNGHASFDPSYATPSAWSQVGRGIDIKSLGEDFQQKQHIDSYTSEGGLTPAAGGRLDFDGKFEATNYAQVSRTPEQNYDFAAARLHVATKLEQVNRQQVGPLMAAAIKAFGSIAGAKPGAMATLDPATKAALVNSLQDLAEGGSLDESADGLRVVTGGKLYGAAHAGLGLGASAPNGKLSAYMDVALDGLTLPDAGANAGLLPSHLALRPSISGIDMHALTELARSAGAHADAKTLAFQAIGLLSTGDVQVAIDTFSLDMGQAKFAGTGAVHIRAPTPQGIDGAARVTAEGYEGFIQQVQALSKTQPNAAKILPGLIYAKGLGKQEGGKTVWNVALANGAVTVNGIDVIPHQPPPGPPSGGIQ